MYEKPTDLGVIKRFRPKFGLIALLAAIAGLSLIFGSYRFYRIQYERNHPDIVAFGKLHRRVQNGATFAEVAEQLPAIRMLPVGSEPSAVHKAAQAAPSGWEPGDEHAQLVIPTGSLRWTIYFQFRKGRLINHEPKDFATVPELAGTSSAP